MSFVGRTVRLKSPKRMNKLLKFIDYLEEVFKYYLGDATEQKFEHEGNHISVSQMFQMLRDSLKEYSAESKVHDIKLLQKFKKQKEEHDEDD